MLIHRACPRCRVGDLVVERGTATCQRCGHSATTEAMRRQMTVKALDAERQRTKEPR